MNHPYCYPGTNVLRNLEDIRDNDELERFERMVTARRLERLPYNLPVTGLPIAVAGYREIHRYVFQDIYDWAGEYRTVDTGRTGPFCKAKYISRYMDMRFAAINDENNLRGFSAHHFATRAAEHISELNAIHCFLEGNAARNARFSTSSQDRPATRSISPASIPRRGTRRRSKAITRRTTGRCNGSSSTHS